MLRRPRREAGVRPARCRPPGDQGWAKKGEQDCSDHKASYDPDCWDCQGSPPTAAPKFTWNKSVPQCPELKVKPNTNTSCICLQAAQAGTTNVITMTASAPGYEVTKMGKRKWTPDPAKCGTVHEEEFGFSAVTWTWEVAGVTARPQSGVGEHADFEYDVPDQGYAVTVNFEATGTPEETNDCSDSKDSGLGLVVAGVIYAPIVILDPFDCASDVAVIYATYLPGDFGAFNWAAVLCVFPEEVCGGSTCTSKWRIAGQVFASGTITISSNNLVDPITGTACQPYNPGDLRPREPGNLAMTIAHEYIHCATLEQLVDSFNQQIANGPLYASKLDCENAITLLEIDFDIAIADLTHRMKTHCPELHGMPKHEVDECGKESVSGYFNCY